MSKSPAKSPAAAKSPKAAPAVDRSAAAKKAATTRAANKADRAAKAEVLAADLAKIAAGNVPPVFVPTIDSATPNTVLVAAIRGDHGPEVRIAAEAEVGRRQTVAEAAPVVVAEGKAPAAGSPVTNPDAPRRADGAKLEGFLDIMSGEFVDATPAQQAKFAAGEADDVPPGFEAPAPAPVADLDAQKAAVEAELAAKTAALPVKAPKAKAAPAPTSPGRPPVGVPWALPAVVEYVFAHGPVTTRELRLAFPDAPAGRTNVQLTGLADSGCIDRIARPDGGYVWAAPETGTLADALAKLATPKAARAAPTPKVVVASELIAQALALLDRAVGMVGASHSSDTALHSTQRFLAEARLHEQGKVKGTENPPAPVPVLPAKAEKPVTPGVAKKITVGDAVKVQGAFRADYLDLLGEVQHGLVVSKVEGRFAFVMPAKGGDRTKVNAAHLIHE